MSGNLIFNNACKVLAALQTDIDAMQALVDAGAVECPNAGQLHSNLDTLRLAAKDMSDIAKREITTLKREKALSRANQMQEDYSRLKNLFDHLRKIQSERAAERDRSELMGSNNAGPGGRRRATAGSKNSGEGPSMSDTSAILMMDGMLKENESLTASDGRLDEFIQMGRGALNELYEQRQLLKSTQRRMYDIANTLGLSSTVIKYIEKRASQDRWVLFGGMVVTLLLMWAIAHFLGRKQA
ncbi:protein transport protein bos1 [Chytriomyces hyalinus]|nr:protein transport protein bos1 [Chytriomyces hyalinus]KAJ3407887.1 protein transport protein bos1 [Chytriomyces hyalinus]